MPRFLSLIRFTEQGARNIEHSIARAAKFRQAVECAGGRILFQYWVVGDVNGCIVFEVASDQKAAALLASLEKDGFVRTETSQAYDEHEFTEILTQVE